MSDALSPKPHVGDLTLDELRSALAALGEPAYRADQVFGWLTKKGAAGFEAMTNLPKAFRAKLDGAFRSGGLELTGVSRSKDRTEKHLFRLADGPCIEAVLIPARERTTVCVSTQVGCRRACAFCASGLHGLVRNLAPSEIVGQVLHVRAAAGEDVSNIVFMGMGEPFDNFDNVARALRILNDPLGLGIAARRMTVSTAGLIPGILRFMELDLQVNLSISLHAVTDEVRSSLMPVNKKYPLEKLIAAAKEYISGGGRKITLEYILFRGVNDHVRDAEGLVRIAARLKAKINLIPYSPVSGLPFETPGDAEILAFLKRIEDTGAPVTLRRSKGRDIQAACGQLAGSFMKGNQQARK
jgi:23S rRNA (adenine2503-C2)-methyltransferase